MIYCLAVFRSRAHVIGFIKHMRAKGIDSLAVNTPLELKLGCGISAKFPISYTNVARQLISDLSLTSFRGFFSIKREGFKQYLTRL